jgi:DNA processing protein
VEGTPTLESTFDLLTANLLPGVGPRGLRLMRDRGLGRVLSHPGEHTDLLPATALSALSRGAARRHAEEEHRRAGRIGVRIVGIDEPTYPELLKHIYDPPVVLYVRGAWPPPSEAVPLAVVGARAATARGLALARGIGRDVARAGVLVVSGLARGIDTAAHTGALDGGGYTLAVLGSGLERLYPRENATLAQHIADRGAVISEFPLGTGPRPGHFPRRNRIIVGCSRAVLVVEAGRRSGALVTARLAQDESRDVLAVPGHPADALAQGTNALIRDGAGLVRSGDDVLSELQLGTSSGPAERVEGLLACLEPDTPSSLDELQERSGRAVPDLLRELTRLELDARVRRLPGSLYLRS